MAAFCERQVHPKTSFDSRSFRIVTSGRARVLVGCPRSSWKSRKRHCAAGLRAYKVLAPANGRCPRGTKRIQKHWR
jgi:hypothetical protein